MLLSISEGSKLRSLPISFIKHYYDKKGWETGRDVKKKQQYKEPSQWKTFLLFCVESVMLLAAVLNRWRQFGCEVFFHWLKRSNCRSATCGITISDTVNKSILWNRQKIWIISLRWQFLLKHSVIVKSNSNRKTTVWHPELIVALSRCSCESWVIAKMEEIQRAI